MKERKRKHSFETNYKTHAENVILTASLPATNAPDIAVMPTTALTGIANFLIFAAPLTQLIDPVGGSGITTDKAVHIIPQYITNADVR